MLHHGIVGAAAVWKLASYYVFIPCPLTIIMGPLSSTVPRTTVRLLCASDAIKFETVLGEGGRTRDRAYWRGERSFLFALVSTRTLSVPFVILLQFVGFSSPF